MQDELTMLIRYQKDPGNVQHSSNQTGKPENNRLESAEWEKGYVRSC